VQTYASTVDGTSVTPTALDGGTTCNTIPAAASVCIDVRAWTGAELDRVDEAIRSLEPQVPDATLTIDGGINRYPMPADMAKALLDEAQRAATDIGVTPPEGAYAAGGSDGNFTATLGIPTLDGLGAVGGHAHGRDEYVNVAAMPERAALLAALLERLLPKALPFTRRPRPVRATNWRAMRRPTTAALTRQAR
jgi:glutamate carboxypeptidase